MAGGLFALLDDVAALARIAAASVDDVGAAAGRASAKAAGVVVDDTAVTPQYLQGSAAERELPIIKKITIGSLRNKLLFILPAALLLSQFLPQALPVLLICGGTYLAYEGAEKVWERIHGGAHHEEQMEQGEFTPEHEAKTVASAIRTDLILSSEIMVIALKEVVDSDPEAGLLERAAILVVVAVLITLLVYGVVALIVKMDDIGLSLARRDSDGAKRVGHALVAAMPRLLAAISLIGTVAMLWVGGHILLTSLDELGVHAPYDVVHHWEEAVHEAIHGPVGSTIAWLVNTAASAVVGLVVGAVAVLVMHLVPRRSKAH
ncbi:DUF808 domain-containing protein [Nocardioides aestuarii]|uniref:DUF808 domain-containing protein n=1 Tax=Nocardioides aestuarii TaxID=252231 RepID=A0ABW4TNF5_9ACTN